MQESINFGTINAVPNPNIQVVSSFYTRVNQVTGEPYQMVLNVALDKNKAESDCCEFPVYIPAKLNYKKEEHLKMLELFRSGVPWVPVKCHVFTLYRQKIGDYYKYFAYANGFTVIDDYSKIVED